MSPCCTHLEKPVYTASNDKVPRHVAIVMDGNGRWAHARGLPRLSGHEAGAESVKCAIRFCRDHGIAYLTLFAFSVENWSRPSAEVNGLMRLLRRFLRSEEHRLHKHQMRMRVIGRREDLSADVRKELERVEAATSKYAAGTLLLALGYGGREEIVQAVRRIAQKVASGELSPETISKDTVSAHLYAPDVPDPDLLIRTSGEMRLSNFLLWQTSYSELYVTPVLWPDFREADFEEAIAEYSRRERRFGCVREDTIGNESQPC